MASRPAASLAQRNARTGFTYLAVAAAMLGLGFAAVPLYDLFCRVTGFGGTTQRASEDDANLAERLAASAGRRTDLDPLRRERRA